MNMIAIFVQISDVAATLELADPRTPGGRLIYLRAAAHLERLIGHLRALATTAPAADTTEGDTSCDHPTENADAQAPCVPPATDPAAGGGTVAQDERGA